MSDEHFENEEQGKGWLERVAEQSWEPELLISGLAIFATSQLPEVFESALYYYQYNLQTGDGFIDLGLPSVIIASSVTAIKLLNYAFILHFVVRAFWVGLIGLNSVFPRGIQYEKLQYSDIYKKEMEKRIGQSGDFLMGADRLASVIFSVAFTVVLLLFAIGFIYSIFFVLMNISKVILPEDVYDIYSTILYAILIVFFLGAAILTTVLNMERFRSKEKIARFHFKITWYLSVAIFPFVLKPLQFLMLNFMSNIPMKKYYTFAAVFFVFFMGTMMLNTLKYGNVNPFNSRNYFISFSNTGVLDQNYYTNSFDDDFIRNPMIDEPIQKAGSYVPVFIPYPKKLDEKLDSFCDFEEPADTLYRFERRALRNEYRLECVNDLFSVSVNDTIPITGELLFNTHQLTGQKGFAGNYYLPDSLIQGQYILSIRQAIVDDFDAYRDSIGRMLIYDANIPFWIE